MACRNNYVDIFSVPYLPTPQIFQYGFTGKNACLVSWPEISLLYYALLLCTLSLRALSSPAKYRREVIARPHGVVATDDGRCSKIGRDVLREGGHAVDAAVAAAFCLGIVSPASSGIGGGDFMLVRLASRKAQAFDFRETASMLASQNMYGGNNSIKAAVPLSVAVPGELAVLHRAWKEYGKLPWERLDGDICHNKKLAQTLRTVARYGIEAFYNGSIGLKLVRDVQKLGGILKMEDLQGYQVRVREPLSAEVLGLKILGMPPPCSGGAIMILVLNILTQFVVPLGISGPLGVHRLIEALKHAFAVRMNRGDPDFVDLSEVLTDMLSPNFAAKLKKKINDSRTFPQGTMVAEICPVDPVLELWNQINDHGTSHLSIVDSEQNAVSMTCTINSYLGSKLLSQSTGIVLNNEMDDFSIPGEFSADFPPLAPVNFVRRSNRPLSSMSPTIILEDEQLKAVIGCSGGVRIIAGTSEVFINYFFKGMDPFSSVMAPRFYHELILNIVYVTGDHFELPAATRDVLEKKGHDLKNLNLGASFSSSVTQERVGTLLATEAVLPQSPAKRGNRCRTNRAAGHYREAQNPYHPFI
ncbi:hypothetical protein RJ641_010335 [Dillenia turbinata]|uniref:Glutathione hydrolase n=1 Tax=Dillenia turbinata TaxID=194707 RepID=A0AAN8Z6B8_9MAGN